MVASTYLNRVAHNYRENPWWGVGMPIPDEISLQDAFEVSKTNYPVWLGEANAYQLIDADGNYLPQFVNDSQLESKSNGIAVLRGPSYDDPNWSVLGKASSRFTIVQNHELVKMVEDFQKFGRVETIGALDDGARFFITFEGSQWDVRLPGGKSDVNQLYMIVKNTHLPGETLQFQLTNVRLVCKNTWVAGDANAMFNLPLAHFADIHQIANMVAQAMAQVPDQIKKQREVMERMARVSVSDRVVRQGIDYAIPMPGANRIVAGLKGAENLPGMAKALQEAQGLIDRKDTQTTVMQERISRQREAAFLTYQESDTVERGTAKGAFDATTESIDWTLRTATNFKQTKKSLQSSFWGEKVGWKERAYEFFSQPEMWGV